jgi:hypothetical protein
VFDLKNWSKTPWNSKIIDLLLGELWRRGNTEGWPSRSEAYLREIIQDHYRCLCIVWKAAQPKITGKGAPETPAEVEVRLIAKKDQTLKVTRQTTRRKVLALILSQKYLRRLMVLNNLVKLKTNNKEEDLSAWQWLQQLVKMLEDCGMSSEESDLENDIETVLRIKNMAWRHAIDRELDIMDRQRLVDDDIFAPQGSKPMKRVCAARNPTSSRVQVDGLPKALYNEQWLMGLTKVQVEKLSILDKKFKWIQVAVA